MVVPPLPSIRASYCTSVSYDVTSGLLPRVPPVIYLYIGSSTDTLMVVYHPAYVRSCVSIEPSRYNMALFLQLVLRVFRFAAQAWPPSEIGRVRRRVPEAASAVIRREAASNSDSSGFGNERVGFVAAENSSARGKHKNR